MNNVYFIVAALFGIPTIVCVLILSLFEWNNDKAFRAFDAEMKKLEIQMIQSSNSTYTITDNGDVVLRNAKENKK